MTLILPWMLMGLAALPALAAIYWLRSRSRRVVVSSLILYAHQRRPRQGGRVLQRMQTPVTFFLELAAIALIVVAAAGPALRSSRTARSIGVVLDDSYSMQAGAEGRSPRALAEAALLEELGREDYQVHVLLAGPKPMVLGEPGPSGSVPASVHRMLEHWRCTAAQANLGEAVSLARAIAGPAARVLVLTDQAPPWPLEGSQVQWWAFGQPTGNVAFTAAVRTRSEGAAGRQRLLLEVANLSAAPEVAELRFEGTGLATVRRLDLKANQRSQVSLELGQDVGVLRAQLGADALAIDNQVLLLPPRDQPLRVSVLLPDGLTRQAVTKALEATGQVLLTDHRADLVISDRPPAPGQTAWHVRIVSSGEVQSYIGPFVIDRHHPLTEGLSLGGVIWSCGSDSAPEGTPILMVGNTVLLAVKEGLVGQPSWRQLTLAADLAASNLQNSPDWPILMANLVAWRLSEFGPADRNVRLGTRVSLSCPQAPSEAGDVEWIPPGRPAVRVPVKAGRVEFLADEVGLHTLAGSTWRSQFACNALAPQESNLLSCASGRWGNWNASPLYQDRLSRWAWAAALLALLVLVAHAIYVAYVGGGRGS
jgi:hypothetical protein